MSYPSDWLTGREVLETSKGIRELVFGVFKDSEEKIDFGKSLYNLDIELMLNTTSFESIYSTSAHHPLNPINQIELYGLAIHSAKEWLKGMHYVSEKGYLIKGYGGGDLEVKKARLDIDDNVFGLIVLDNILREKIEDNDEGPRVHLHYDNWVDYIRVEERNMYLDNVRKGYGPQKKLEGLVEKVE